MIEPGGQLSLLGAMDGLVLRRSARARRLALRVFPHGLVEVVAPLGAGRRSIEAFVRGNAAWIDRARGDYRALQADPGLVLPREIHLAALGERWTVDCREGGARVRAESVAGGGNIILSGPVDDRWRRERLRAWLMARARATLLPWLATVSAEVALPYAGASVRRQRSRWGSCSARGTISLNCALLFVAPALVRHLFLHELAHTRHLDHSRAFWRLLGELQPEFELREQELAAAWRLVPAWLNHDPF